MTDPLSPGAQPLAMPAPPPRIVRDEPRDNPPVLSLGSILVLGLIAVVMAVVFIPSFVHPHGTHRLASDANNLKQLWTMQANYMVQFGGREKLMPPDTGRDFWTRLAKTTPPLIDSTLGDIYDCPLSPTLGGIENCEYRGPASDVNAYGDGDVVGADIDGNHGEGEGGIVLRKSGDVMNYAAADPLWLAAAVKTR